MVLGTVSAAGLDEDSSNYTSTGSVAAHFGAHIQGILLAGGMTTSGAVKDGSPPDPPLATVPEPSTLLLIGSALLLLGAGRGLRERAGR